MLSSKSKRILNFKRNKSRQKPTLDTDFVDRKMIESSHIVEKYYFPAGLKGGAG